MENNVYMKIAVNYICIEEEEFDEELYNQVEELHNKLKKYKCGNAGMWGDLYLLKYNSDLFLEIKQLCLTYQDQVISYMEHIFKELDNHIDDYKGFLIYQPVKLVRYNRELFNNPCECRCYVLKEKEFYEVGKVSTRRLKEYDLFQLGDGIELLYCVTPKLKEELENITGDSVDFREIRSKGETIAYAMLPENEYSISCASLWDIERCSECGRLAIYYNQDKRWNIERYVLEDESISCPISWSDVYFQGLQQRIIISKECYKVFRKYVGEENFKPIF